MVHGLLNIAHLARLSATFEGAGIRRTTCRLAIRSSDDATYSGVADTSGVGFADPEDCTAAEVGARSAAYGSGHRAAELDAGNDVYAYTDLGIHIPRRWSE